VLGARPLTAGAKRLEDSRELSDAVANDPNAIGFIGLPYIRSAKALAISEQATRPLLPNRLTVSTEDYLLNRRLFLYTPASPRNDLTRKFIDFALSRSGQDIVDHTGFVGQNIVENVPPQSNPTAVLDAPTKYREITTGAQRLSLNFRFQTGSSVLDNKAVVDLDRVVSFLSDLHYQGDNLLLLGFADSTGSESANCVLSKSRAKVVASEFERRGVQTITVEGFCAQMPVASNDTAEGREKNRRVEIWVKK
jgi:phosphate transport system substrate-binding protein